jgi:hypothetical protein
MIYNIFGKTFSSVATKNGQGRSGSVINWPPGSDYESIIYVSGTLLKILDIKVKFEEC